ncbi:TetR/AcrR family transcriptional regulator [Roseivivax sediminis]|uniref:DNA-binding transcriptional regulator, AcrR family n=1 Tax=Roseivivax sediminis TaxID=936889 RepID=A0A1I2AR19_9RHOB|nr:TetR/AcrR family transcriptional regulator [Roseivivax sediminis]SFE46475.1 DNA-binding transcriptional regulator, AcrR family [Roseivivax sediminis]
MTEPAPAELKWMRCVQQTRSRRTQGALLDAGERLFAERGRDETSVTEIAAAADVSVGALYHHFRDKSALYIAVIERIGEEMACTNAAALDPCRWEGRGISEILRGYITFVLRDVAPTPMVRLLDSPDLATVPELRDRILALKAEFNRGLAALLRARIDEIDHPDPDRAIAYVVDYMAAMSKWRGPNVIWPRQSDGLTDDQFIEEALRAAFCYLGLKETAAATG